MPRVNRVEKARVDQGTCRCGKEIKRGDAYKWIKFRFGGRRIKCADCDFKASELTQSEFLGQVYDLNDRIAAITDDMSLEDIQSEVDDIATEFENLASECEDKLSNMPEGLQQGSVGEMLQSRSDSCNEVAGNLQGVDFDFDEESERESAVEELDTDGVHSKTLTDEKKAEFRADAEYEIKDVMEHKEHATSVTYTDELLVKFLERTKTEEGRRAEVEERYQELCDEWVEDGLDEDEFEEKVTEKIDEKRQEKATEIVEEIMSMSYEGE